MVDTESRLLSQTTLLENRQNDVSERLSNTTEAIIELRKTFSQKMKALEESQIYSKTPVSAKQSLFVASSMCTAKTTTTANRGQSLIIYGPLIFIIEQFSAIAFVTTRVTDLNDSESTSDDNLDRKLKDTTLSLKNQMSNLRSQNEAELLNLTIYVDDRINIISRTVETKLSSNVLLVRESMYNTSKAFIDDLELGDEVLRQVVANTSNSVALMSGQDMVKTRLIEELRSNGRRHDVILQNLSKQVQDLQHTMQDQMQVETREFNALLADDEVIVRVEACGVNFADIYTRLGLMPDISLPTVIGLEASGVIEAVGPRVLDLKVGDRVLIHTGNHGLFQEKLKVQSRFCTVLPPGIGLQEALVLCINYLTAYFSLLKVGNLREGESVLITSAG
ncbi:hypothetical protein QYM36_007077, partial [Artemia franciscana]